MFYLQVPDVNVSILDIEDSALFRLKHFATYTKFNDKPKYDEYLRTSTLLDCAGFACLRFDIKNNYFVFVNNYCRLFLLLDFTYMYCINTPTSKRKDLYYFVIN